ENTALTTSFFFHPVAQKYEFILLLSSFTHTRACARAHARKGACVRGGGERRKKFGARPCRVTQMSHKCHEAAHVGRYGDGSRRGDVRPSWRTRRGTWPHVGPRRACQSGRAKNRRRDGG